MGKGAARPVTMPMEIGLFRHGESEANRAQWLDNHKVITPEIDEIFSRHDFSHHLTQKGVWQVKQARQFLLDEGAAPEEYYDEWYVSTHVRPTETFAYLTDGKADAIPSVLLTERDWGDYGRTTQAKRKEIYAEVERLKEVDSFHTRYPGGEAILDLLVRQKLVLDTLTREMTDQRVGLVCHGEQMWGFRYWLEGLTPERWSEMDRDKSLRIGNCAIMSYRRDDPEGSGLVVPRMSQGWRRIVDPVERDKSPYGGEWVKLGGRVRIVGSEALAAAEAYQDRMPDDWLGDLLAAHDLKVTRG